MNQTQSAVIEQARKTLAADPELALRVRSCGNPNEALELLSQAIQANGEGFDVEVLRAALRAEQSGARMSDTDLDRIAGGTETLLAQWLV